MPNEPRTPTEVVVGWSSHSDFCRDCRFKATCYRRTYAEVESCEFVVEQRRRDDGLMARGEQPMLHGSAARFFVIAPEAVVRGRNREELEDEADDDLVEVDA